MNIDVMSKGVASRRSLTRCAWSPARPEGSARQPLSVSRARERGPLHWPYRDAAASRSLRQRSRTGAAAPYPHTHGALRPRPRGRWHRGVPGQRRRWVRDGFRVSPRRRHNRRVYHTLVMTSASTGRASSAPLQLAFGGSQKEATLRTGNLHLQGPSFYLLLG